ncbi:hypothetical protein [Carnobacterium funditum]|uniref:hypothetical protein n=1 Tax=Carnobacterium funditum TaxID=2752 RepID=UPI000558FE2E|nr:hypothetical protein [Carnobacterium funditum]
MKALEQFSEYFSGYIEDQEVVLYYADTRELAHTYEFEMEEEANTFYQLCLRVGEMVEEVPENKRASAHQVFINESLKNVNYKATTY